MPIQKLQVLLPVIGVPGFVEGFRHTTHSIGQEPRLVIPGVELTFDRHRGPGFQRSAVRKGLPGVVINESPGACRKNPVRHSS